MSAQGSYTMLRDSQAHQDDVYYSKHGKRRTRRKNCTWEHREQVWELTNPWNHNIKRKTLTMAKKTEVNFTKCNYHLITIDTMILQ